MDTRHYECNACRFSAPITPDGVDRMREHLKTHPLKEQRDAYVVAKGSRNA